MTRKCSQCSNNGHNSRTCTNRGVMIFGVRLTDGSSSSVRNSVSIGNLTRSAAAGSPAAAAGHNASGDAAEGYASENFVQGSSSSSRGRKRGVPWTEEEHRLFLAGLEKQGKGDWRGIAQKFVISRTPTQVASHAQKYFIRQTNVNSRRRRSSIFDIIPDESVDPQLLPMNEEEPEEQSNNPLSVPPTLEEESESTDSNNFVDGDSAAPFWQGYGTEASERHTHDVVKSTPVHSKPPINGGQLFGMPKLSIRASLVDTPSVPSSLSQNLPGGSNRQSAFHTNPPPSGSGMKSSTGPIKAVQ